MATGHASLLTTAYWDLFQRGSDSMWIQEFRLSSSKNSKSSFSWLICSYDYYASDINSDTYDPEYRWNYEVGLKSTWLDNMVIANMSAFYIKIYDKQIAEYLGSNIVKISNVGDAESTGLELKLRVRPITDVELYDGLGYTKLTSLIDLIARITLTTIISSFLTCLSSPTT